MKTPTWGLHIPGYSYPSVAQERKFKKMYPHVTIDTVQNSFDPDCNFRYICVKYTRIISCDNIQELKNLKSELFNSISRNFNYFSELDNMYANCRKKIEELKNTKIIMSKKDLDEIEMQMLLDLENYTVPYKDSLFYEYYYELWEMRVGYREDKTKSFEENLREYANFIHRKKLLKEILNIKIQYFCESGKII